MSYKTSATPKGGRNGRSMLDSGGLALAMALPKELDGAGDGHNPEQLFALGYEDRTRSVPIRRRRAGIFLSRSTSLETR